VFIAYIQLLLSNYLLVAVVVEIVLAILTYTLARQLYVSMGGRDDVIPTTHESWAWLWVILCAACFILTVVLLVAIVIALTAPSVHWL
jgi:hypothetical protein